jgi:hypothetical protein
MEDIQFYQCCSCGVYWPRHPDSIGAIDDNLIYCPECAEKCNQLETSLWNQFLTEHSIPTTKDVNLIKWTVWRYLALP